MQHGAWRRGIAAVVRAVVWVLGAVDNCPALDGPHCMELSADRRPLRVTSRWARTPSFIDVATRPAVRQINVARSPRGMWMLDHVAQC